MAKVIITEEEILLKVGARIRELRLKKGYSSYEKFAYDSNISRAQIGRYEQGRDLQLSSLIKVCKALDIKLSDFFDTSID